MSAIENFGKFLEMTGLDGGHLAWWLANVDWPSDAARDDFITKMTGPAPS